jgi:preprotein translocase subunit SecA
VDPILEEDGSGPALAPAPQAPPAPPQRQAAPQRQAQPQAARRPPAAPAEDGAELPAGLARGLARPKRTGQLSYSAPNEDGTGKAEHVTTADGPEYANVGRNAPCPCGSGRKFKQCHGDPRNR